jgi:oligopeptide transport system ATP-binding protein
MTTPNHSEKSASADRTKQPQGQGPSQPLLEARNVVKHFPIHGGLLSRVVGRVHAVDDVSFKVMPGQTLGLVGESGCGKSTLGRTLLKLIEPTSGEILFEGRDISGLSQKEMRPLRRDIQIIFQDPFASLNPRMSVGEILSEPFEIHGLYKNRVERMQRVQELLTEVGLQPAAASRYPHEFSGGQRQRIGIARALALKPRLIIADEPVSALDVSIQSQILNLMMDLKERYNLSYIFIAHDLAVIEHISDHVAVMYLGEVVEYASARSLYENPSHPYTQALIASIPVPEINPNKKKVVLEGDVPSPINPPSGCRFHTRCPFVQDICKSKAPKLQAVGGADRDHLSACHFTGQLGGASPSAPG